MIKSKKYTGVYHRKSKNGEITYYFTYKEGYKTRYQKVGTKSQGIDESYVNEQRLKTITVLKTGELPPKLVRDSNKRYKITVDDIAQFYFSNHKTKSSEKRQRQYNITD